MAIDDTYKLELHQQVHNVNLVNIFHYKQVTSSTDDAPQLIAAFLNTVLTTWRNMCGPEWKALCVIVSRLLPTEGSRRFGVLTPPVTGMASGECMPANSVVVGTWYTNEVSKTGRGRSYFSGFPEAAEGRNNLVNSNWEAFVNTLNVINSTQIGSPSDGSWKLVIWSPKDQVTYDVEAFEGRTPIKKLRSRTPRIC